MADVHAVRHPLVHHKLARLRDRATPPDQFRRLVHELGLLLAVEATRHLPTRPCSVQTPLETCTGQTLAGGGLVLVPVLRAGLGLLDSFLTLVPEARIGHVGLYRDPQSLEAIDYYCKLPDGLEDCDALVLDPMLATGHSAVAALQRVRAARPRTLGLVCLVGCPEGIAAVQAAHPDVAIVTAAVDRGLNAHGYILPGLGDAGDRQFGTG